MKNFVREGQKLPMFGIGPYLVLGMALLTALCIVMFSYIFKVGILSGLWILVFRAAGLLFILSGLAVWSTGALRSGMDENIAGNKLKTDGIYACVRNPMYSGVWFMIFGVSLLWHNICLVPVFILNWMIITVTLINTEEKWLKDTYGSEYEDYRRRVNRCIPWFPERK